MTIQHYETLEYYKDLLERINSLTEELYQKYEDDIKCCKGCADCCTNVFNISIVEAFYLQSGVEALSSQEKTQIAENVYTLKRKLKLENIPHDELRCPLLAENNSCYVYEHRPIVCRIFGFPMLDEKTSQIATCPLNFTSKREHEETLNTINTTAINAQTIILSQCLLREQGKNISEKDIPPLFSILSILESIVGTREEEEM